MKVLTIMVACAVLLSACQQSKSEDEIFFDVLLREQSRLHRLSNEALLEHDKCLTSECKAKSLAKATYWNEEEWKNISKMRSLLDKKPN